LKDFNASISNTFSENELELVKNCVMCGEPALTPAYSAVQDWAFKCVVGTWVYHECARCNSLTLSPRPKEDVIGRAYNDYYTHRRTKVGSLRQRVKNELLFLLSGKDCTPRIGVADSFYKLFKNRSYLRKYLSVPVQSILDRQPGHLLDFGCGNGDFLKVAETLGWDAFGLELDERAILAARNAGHTVERGGPEALAVFEGRFDVINLNHVLEHLYRPTELISAVYKALRPDGVCVISVPIADSDQLKIFGRYWRGLEAPRHICIPSEASLRDIARTQGFMLVKELYIRDGTSYASLKIAKMANAYSEIYQYLVKGFFRNGSSRDFYSVVLRKI
jgi:SAM-dependent methyltransferase